MHQLHRDEVDQKIHNFMSRKTSGKGLSEVITDWIMSPEATESQTSTGYYEVLPWSSNVVRSKDRV